MLETKNFNEEIQLVSYFLNEGNDVDKKKYKHFILNVVLFRFSAF